MSLIKLSVSKTKTFIQCNKRYHFTYILKLPTSQKDFHIFGRFLHAVLENFHRAYIQGSMLAHNKQMEIAYKQALVEYSSQLSQDAKKEAYQIIDEYLKQLSQTPSVNEKKYVSTIMDVEKNFTLPISEKVALTGMIDFIRVDPDGVICVGDYKTTKNKKYLEKDWLQLLTYAWVILQEDPTLETIRGSYVLLRHNFENISKDFSREEILQVKKLYEDYASQIENEQDWKANIGPLCNYCDFKDKCEEFQAKLKQKTPIINEDIKFGVTKWN